MAEADALSGSLMAEIQQAMGLGEIVPRTIGGGLDRFGMRQRVASEDAIRTFCNGIGNLNPLYRSRDYATASVHGGIVAPPHFLHAISFQGGIQRKSMPRISGGLYGGNSAVWHRPIRAGDTFTVHTVAGVVRDISRPGALQFLWPMDTVYRNQRGERVATFTSSTIFFAAEGARKGGARLRSAPPVRRFSRAEIERWYELMASEPVRGPEPRYWEDVEPGEELPPTRQVFTPAQSISFFAGCAWFEDWRFRMVEQLEGRPGVFSFEPDPESGIPELDDPWWHVFDDAARRTGMDRAFCPGRLMECWLGSLVGNWTGDCASLEALSCQFRALLFSGSLVTCRGIVAGKRIDGERHIVDLELTLEDHNGVVCVPGAKAIVSLPTRTGDLPV